MFVDILRKVKEVQFFALMALLIAIESILVFAGALPPMMENNIGHSVFFLLRIAVFLCFAWTLIGKTLVQTLVKGAVIALVGVVTQVIFIFIGKATGQVLLGIATPSDTFLYIVLSITTVINVLFGAVFISLAAWIFSQIRSNSRAVSQTAPKAVKRPTKAKRRKR